MTERAGQARLPLYQAVKAELVRAIAAGEYTPGEPFVTQREICERFNVSNATAVRALNDLVVDGLLVRRRGRGTFVADASRPGHSAEGDSRSIMCAISLLHDQSPHTTRLIRGVETVCAELGYRMFLTDTKGDPAREEQALVTAARGGVSGVVLYSVQGTELRAALTGLLRRGVPTVMVDRYRQEVAVDAVVADDFAVGYELTERLIAAGHTEIAVLWEETDSTSVRDRLAGHLQALRQRGIQPRPELSVLLPYLGRSDQERDAALRSLLHRAAPATAIMCGNGYVLAAVIHDLSALGVPVPDGMELACMDDAGQLGLSALTLASAVLPSEEIGRRAMRILADRLADPEQHVEPQHVVLPIAISTRDDATGRLRLATQSGLRPL